LWREGSSAKKGKRGNGFTIKEAGEGPAFRYLGKKKESGQQSSCIEANDKGTVQGTERSGEARSPSHSKRRRRSAQEDNKIRDVQASWGGEKR